MFERVELLLMTGSAAVMAIAATFAPFVSARLHRRGTSAWLALFVNCLLCGGGFLAAFASMTWIAAVIDEHRSIAQPEYHPIFTGESKIVGYLLWFAALFVIFGVGVVAGAIAIGRTKPKEL